MKPLRSVEYRAVAIRAKGKCELRGCLQDPLDPHHCWGRGGLPGIPVEVCESRESILGICRECHDLIHNGNAHLRDEARWQAIALFAVRHGLDLLAFSLVEEHPKDPLEAMRRLVREWEGRQES